MLTFCHTHPSLSVKYLYVVHGPDLQIGDIWFTLEKRDKLKERPGEAFVCDPRPQKSWYFHALKL